MAPFRAIDDPQYDEGSGEFRAGYDPSAPGELLVDLVFGVDPKTLEPVSRVLDPDGFERRVSALHESGRLPGGPISFRLGDCLVTVTDREVRFARKIE